MLINESMILEAKLIKQDTLSMSSSLLGLCTLGHYKHLLNDININGLATQAQYSIIALSLMIKLLYVLM